MQKVNVEKDPIVVVSNKRIPKEVRKELRELRAEGYTLVEIIRYKASDTCPVMAWVVHEEPRTETDDRLGDIINYWESLPSKEYIDKYVVPLSNLKMYGNQVYLQQGPDVIGDIDWSSKSFILDNIELYTFTEEDIEKVGPEYLDMAIPLIDFVE